MPALDPNAPAHYSFIPWFRRGIINLADSDSLAAKDPVAVTLSLQATGDGEAPAAVTRQVQLVGPGQVIGLDRRSIVRTVPRAGVRDFEANFLCAIEFYDEDLPWRYTPALPIAGQLPPWLWLVVLATDEFVRRAPSEGTLPAIELNPGALATALPDPATTWAWAHTHLNFQVTGGTLAESRQLVAGALEDNPNLGCSRLICPRRLRPGTHYTAFLIPAFEKGRQVGLGQEEAEIAKTDNSTPSWGGRDNQRVFPIYYEWEFATQNAGDFESLASRLAPLSPTEAEAIANSQASRQMDIRDPGWGLAYSAPPGTISLESALRPVNQVSESLITEKTTPADQDFVKKMANLLNLGTETLSVTAGQNPNPFFSDSNLEDDPIIVPPLYGSFYRGSSAAGGASQGHVVLDPAPPITDWFNQLNLNPIYRVAASQGAAVVQQDQERYIDRAWDQLNQNYEGYRLVKRWTYSLELSQTLFDKRLRPILESDQPEAKQEDTFMAVAFMAPLYQKLILENKSFVAAIQGKPLPAAYSRSFTKVIRAGGPLARRLNTQQTKGVFFENAVESPPMPTNFLFPSVNNLINYLDSLQVIITPAGRPINPLHLKPVNSLLLKKGDGVFHRPESPLPRNRKDGELKKRGLGGYNSCRSALIALKPHLLFLDVIFRRGPGNDSIYRTIANQVSPRATLPARLKSLLAATTNPNVQEGISQARLDGATAEGRMGIPGSVAPVFPEAMYAALAARSTDYLLPGLGQVPLNRVALLKTNPAFIEAYMIGLNHEISREYLWREFPAPLNTTAFSQFWDKRDNLADTSSSDISTIASWGHGSLGTHQPAGKVAEKMVILIRGDLLQKYPHTEIFLQQAGPQPGTILYPLFSARLDPDLRFIGFDLSPTQALGIGKLAPPWLFVLKERAGEVHFGLDLEASATDPSWEALAEEVPEHSCINVSLPGFQALPRYKGARADHLASMLFQKPFMLLVPAQRLVPQP